MGHERSPSLLDDVRAWLETLAADHDGLAGSLGDTVVPTIPWHDTTVDDARSPPGDAAISTSAALTAMSAATSGTLPGTGAPRPTDSGARGVALLRELAGVSPTSSAQLRPGAVIAEGGMGVIREGFQVGLGRTVAIKTLRPGSSSTRGELDLLREAWVTGAVEHPNVVPIHYAGIDDAGEPMIVMRRVEGVEWSSLIRDADAVRARFGTTDLLAWNLGILMQLLNALRFAHARGIVHRDLKPSNVMIGEFGEVYLLDWGIAVSLQPDALGRLPLATGAAELAGTPVYMAPEMLGRDGSTISAQTDVYLAGAVLFEIIAGHPPHLGTTVIEVFTKVALSEPALPANVPDELARICMRAMQAEPGARFATADELRLALVAYLEHRGSSRLLEVANARLANLMELLATPRPARPSGSLDATGVSEGPDVDDEIYRLFGACRFGYHEALAAWRDNPGAARGLVHATTAVAEYELAGGDPRAAVTLLAELDEPPPALIARARAEAAAQAVRQQEAEQLRRQHDQAIGTRTRSLAMGSLGVFFTALPLVAAIDPTLLPMLPSHGAYVTWSLVLFVVVLGFGIWARESLTATVLNRRAFLGMQTLFLGQVLLCATTWQLGIPIVPTEILLMFQWSVMSVMAAIGIDRRIVPGAVGYLLALVIATRVPEDRYLVMACANGWFTVSLVAQWWPTRGSPRARRPSRPRP